MHTRSPTASVITQTLRVFLYQGNIDTHYTDVIISTIASQITSLTIVYSTVYSDTDQRKHQSSASLAFVWGIHQGQVNSPHNWPVTRKMFPFDDVIMILPPPDHSHAWEWWYAHISKLTDFHVSMRMKSTIQYWIPSSLRLKTSLHANGYYYRQG